MAKRTGFPERLRTDISSIVRSSLGCTIHVVATSSGSWSTSEPL